MRFHRRCGDRVTLLHDNITAVRNFVEFNHGLILSAEPLPDNVIFEVRIDRKVNVWNGSLEIGVTTLDPETMELPATATKLRNTAWIMSGNAIMKDGVTLVNSYGPELDTLREGAVLGVMRSCKGELIFYINGRSLGVAAQDMPPRLFAVIDLYGQCVQVSITHTSGIRTVMESSLDQIEEDAIQDHTLTSSEDVPEVFPGTSCPKDEGEVCIFIPEERAVVTGANDRLRFHQRCGILVTLSANNKSAERTRPLDDYNNGVVMTHRPLYDNELFEIRIDRLVDKWSGSLEVGVTTHNPANIKFPSTMTNMDSGTIMMSGSKVLLNGHGTCIEYGNFNLDELREGDTVGMMRKSNGELHYFINGIDQGVATDKVGQPVWGVIDLYGMTVKVTIVDPYEDVECIEIPTELSMPDLSEPPGAMRPQIDEDSLLFHTLRDSYVIIINDGKTAHRPNAFEFFNNCVVMTNRTLRTNELFQVRLDLVIPKWAGSIEIGVTQHNSHEIHYRFKLSNSTNGTWVLSGEDVVRDATIIMPRYVRSLDILGEGDTVGVMRKDRGVLHFFVNGVDQGPAAFNVPDHVFGIVDLYGRIAQATIIDSQSSSQGCSPDSPISLESNATIYPEMCFHRVHGRNARLSRTRVTAFRAAVYSEFNDAVLFSSRPLRECAMFEVRIDTMVDCWIGSLEIGVTAIRPEELEANGLAGTATDLCWDTYILSGSAMMKDGECIRSGYPLDLDTLTVGSRVGMMWHADRSLHYYLDGMDMGKAWYVPHLNIHAVVDLYGQCTQVTIIQHDERTFNFNGDNSNNSIMSIHRPLASPPPPYWSFSEYCGENVVVTHDYTLARRLTSDPMGALVFSSNHLAVGEIFEIKILDCKESYAGSFRMGVTDVNILNAHVNRSLPPSVAGLPHYTAYIDGKYLRYSKPGTRKQDIKAIVPSFEWVRDGDRIGFKKTTDNRVLVYYNCELLETTINRVPDKVYVVMEIYGSVYKIQAVTRGNPVVTIPQPISNDCGESKTDSEEACEAEGTSDDPEASTSNAAPVPVEPRRRRAALPYTFHYIHGKNIKLCSSDTVAMRTSGYQDAVAIVSQPLRRGYRFRFRVDKIDESWDGSLCIGAVPFLPTESLPEGAMRLDPPAWIISSDLKYNGNDLMTHEASELDEVVEQSVLTLHFRFSSELLVDIDGNVLGAIGYVPRNYGHVYPLVDLYGKVSQISVLLHPYTVVTGTSLDLPVIVENRREEDSLTEANVDIVEDEAPVPPPPIVERVEVRRRWKSKASSQDSLMESYDHIIEPGPSCMSKPHVSILNNELRNKEIKNRTISALHHSLILNATDNKETSLRGVQRSFSTNDCIHHPETEHTVLPIQFINQHLYDTNIRHNDRYPETNDVDYLDYEIMDALGLESGNLPDLSEEQSSSIDESTRRDDLSSEPLSYEHLIYIHKILGLHRDTRGQQSLEAEWEAMGERCEHLHATLKYWFDLVVPFQELRRELCSGYVRCFCTNCDPTVEEDMAGWVCIEKRDSERENQGFWRLKRSTLSMAQAVCLDVSPRRPRLFRAGPPNGASPGEVWTDAERKGHQILMAVEIDVDENDQRRDRLKAFWIHMKPAQVVPFGESAHSLSLEE